MVSLNKQTAILFFCFLIAFGAHAEGGCPAGYYPIGAQQGQQGPQGCAPIPNYDKQQTRDQLPHVRWQKKWGAIARDSSTGLLGAAEDQPSEQQARDAAGADCHNKTGTACEVISSYGNTCAALVSGNSGYAIALDNLEDGAAQKATSMCVDGGARGCHVQYSGCSLPLRIQ